MPQLPPRPLGTAMFQTIFWFIVSTQCSVSLHTSKLPAYPVSLHNFQSRLELVTPRKLTGELWSLDVEALEVDPEDLIAARASSSRP